MINIVLLGSRGKIGKYFLAKKKEIYNIFTDTEYSIEELINSSFLNENNIKCIVNCIGSFKKESTFFHANFFLPLEITKELIKFTEQYHQRINFIHVSSIGVNDPYGRMSLEPFVLKVSERKILYFNNYELSKCCSDYHIKYSLEGNNQIQTTLLQPSTILNGNSIFLSKLFLFLIIFPFNLSEISSPPFTKLDSLVKKIYELIMNKNYSSGKVVTYQCYGRENINNLFPKYKYFSFLKMNINRKQLIKLITLLDKLKLFKSITRVLKFLCFL